MMFLLRMILLRIKPCLYILSKIITETSYISKTHISHHIYVVYIIMTKLLLRKCSILVATQAPLRCLICLYSPSGTVHLWLLCVHIRQCTLACVTTTILYACTNPGMFTPEPKSINCSMLDSTHVCSVSQCKLACFAGNLLPTL